MGHLKGFHRLPFWSALSALFLLSVWSAASNAVVSDGALVSFQLPDGDNVTCYPIESQPSLNGSTSYNLAPTTTINPGSSTNQSFGAKLSVQTIAQYSSSGGARCPTGTIPSRTSRGSWGVGARRHARAHRLAAQAAAPTPHEYAIGVLENSGANSNAFKGTELFINVWQPFVQNLREFSLAQLWLLGVTGTTIEAGYQCSTGHYGDGLPRLFVYWTADGYNQTGCYDLSCAGFVQVSSNVLIGGSFASISVQSGQQYEIHLRVFRDDGTGDWWLQLNGEYVGYWPSAIYKPHTFLTASAVEWGGEIVDNESGDGNQHTQTDMGSGQFAVQGYRKAAYQRSLQYIDLTNTLVDAPVSPYNSSAGCYSILSGSQPGGWGSYFYYGGPGLSSTCLRDPAFAPPPPAS